MSKPLTACRRASDPSFRHDSVISTPANAHPPNRFPASHHLIITTTRGVYAWAMSGVVELFRSGSEGIIAARKLGDNSNTLAVADSQVVILHDVNNKLQKSYRLKGSEVIYVVFQKSRLWQLNIPGPDSPPQICWRFVKEPLLHHNATEFDSVLLLEAFKIIRSFRHTSFTSINFRAFMRLPTTTLDFSATFYHSSTQHSPQFTATFDTSTMFLFSGSRGRLPP